MKLISEILESKYFLGSPPVLIDIGASGEINKKWELIAPYSTCLAFDADDRDFSLKEVDNSKFKKLITINRIVTADHRKEIDFYLTSSPYCSSLLKPDQHKLKPWIFHGLFEIGKQTSLPAVTIGESLKQAGINYIDWFKTDTQGTDLRLFKSIPGELSQNILAAEFEPGIMDAYQGEDKLHNVMAEMENKNFWLSSMNVKGTQRLNTDYISQLGEFSTKRVIRKSPCWAEVTYLKQTFEGTERQLLLLFVFALLERQHGFALEVIDHAATRFTDPLFSESKKLLLNILSRHKWKVPMVMIKRQLNKLLAKIHD